MANEELLTALRELAEHHFGVDGTKMTPEASLHDVGIDSFQFIELVFLVEEKFGITVDLEAMRVNTVSDVLNELQQLLAEPKCGT